MSAAVLILILILKILKTFILKTFLAVTFALYSGADVQRKPTETVG